MSDAKHRFTLATHSLIGINNPKVPNELIDTDGEWCILCFGPTLVECFWMTDKWTVTKIHKKKRM